MKFIPSITFNDGARIVRLQVCSQCAATVIDDPRDDGTLLDLHREWHEKLALVQGDEHGGS
jgi:hypothetical protein